MIGPGSNKNEEMPIFDHFPCPGKIDPYIFSYGYNTIGNRLYGFMGLQSKMSDWMGDGVDG